MRSSQASQPLAAPVLLIPFNPSTHLETLSTGTFFRCHFIKHRLKAMIKHTPPPPPPSQPTLCCRTVAEKKTCPGMFAGRHPPPLPLSPPLPHPPRGPPHLPGAVRYFTQSLPCLYSGSVDPVLLISAPRSLGASRVKINEAISRG